MSYVTLTGMLLWLQRRQDAPAWQKLARAVPIVGYGLPMALAASGLGFFLSLNDGDPFFWTSTGFWLAAALAVGLGLIEADARKLARNYQIVLALTLISLPLSRMLTSGVSWADALSSDNALVVSMDIFLLLLAAFFLHRGGLADKWRGKVLKEPQGGTT